MAIKYWEFEDAPLKEKLKNVNIREIAKIFFDNETEAYRFAYLMLEVKRRKGLGSRTSTRGSRYRPRSGTLTSPSVPEC